MRACRPSRAVCFGTLFILSVAAFAPARAEPPVSAPAPRLARSEYPKLTVEQLIDKLQEESQQGIGFHTTALASGFLADDSEPRFEGGILGSPKPVTSLVLRELVRRGSDALPKLLEHIDDKRPTRLVVEHKWGIGAMWYADEYAPRYADPKKWPAKVNTGHELQKIEHVEKYTVRVGDLCFVAVGQIVNRRLTVLRYQPTACLVINSPVETPSLAAAVKKDWQGLTADQHQQSLIQDAHSRRPLGHLSAVRRLQFYYPKSGEEVLRKLFARPLYDSDVVEEFARELAAEPDPDKWKVRAADFRKKHGDGAANAAPGELWSQANSHDEAAKRQAGRDRAEKILASVYPDYDHNNPLFINAISAYEQMQLVQELADFRSAIVEKLILDVFRAVARDQSASKTFWYKLDHLAFTCMSQLIGRGYDDEFNNFLAARVKAIEAGDMDFFERCELRDLREWQKRLAK